MKADLYKPILLCIVLGIQYFTAHAQIGVNIEFVNNDINYSGKITTETNNPNYLFQAWNKGSVRLENDSIYRDLDLMYDISNNRPIFKSENGKPQMFKLDVKEFSITLIKENEISIIKRFKKGFPSIDGNELSKFYEILSEGKATLLKNTQIKVVDERPVGSIISVKQKQAFNSYFIYLNGNMFSVKKDKKHIFAILDKTKYQIFENYIKSNNLNLKDDLDLIKFINYYNKL